MMTMKTKKEEKTMMKMKTKKNKEEEEEENKEKNKEKRRRRRRRGHQRRKQSSSQVNRCDFLSRHRTSALEFMARSAAMTECLFLAAAQCMAVRPSTSVASTGTPE